MKTFTRILTAAALLLAAGCVNEDPAYKQAEGPGASSGDARGYLSIARMGLNVIYDAQTDTQPDDTAGETAKRPAARPTRAEEDLSAYAIEIYNAEGTLQHETTYGALGAMTEALELPVGSYRMEIYSEPSEVVPASAWDHPVYGTTYDFTIEKDQTHTIEKELVCTMQNIKVTLMCSADLAAQLSDETVSTVTLGSESMTFPKGETRAAFFMPADKVSTLDFRLTGTFVDGGDVSFTKSIPDVRAGQWRKITLVIAYADKGDVKFDIRVDTFVLDDEVIVNGSADLLEPVIDEAPLAAPTVSWEGHDLSEPFQLTEAMFSRQNGIYVCSEPCLIALSARNGIGKCEVAIASDNSELIASLAAYGLSERFDLCAIGESDPAYEPLKTFGFPVGDELKGAATATFDLAGAMPLLYYYPGYDGTHRFAFRITDIEDEEERYPAEGTLTIQVDRLNEGAAAPAIAWVGYDIDKQYELTSGMPIDIDIQAPAGIKAFNVTIISEVLAPFLSGIGLPSSFDLCRIEGDVNDVETVAGMLHNFNFPINEEVRDKTSFDPLFSITAFVDIILGIEFSDREVATYDFRLAVTDNNGKTTTKTIQLKVTKK